MFKSSISFKIFSHKNSFLCKYGKNYGKRNADNPAIANLVAGIGSDGSAKTTKSQV
jgi:hypothetical protein